MHGLRLLLADLTVSTRATHRRSIQLEGCDPAIDRNIRHALHAPSRLSQCSQVSRLTQLTTNALPRAGIQSGSGRGDLQALGREDVYFDAGALPAPPHGRIQRQGRCQSSGVVQGAEKAGGAHAMMRLRSPGRVKRPTAEWETAEGRAADTT